MKKYLLPLLILCLLAPPACSQVVNFEKEFPYRSVFSWPVGMRFQMPAEPSSFGCPLLPYKGPAFKGTDLYSRGSSFDEKTLAGQVLTFQGLNAFQDRGHDNTRTDGYEKVAIRFRAADGRLFAHIINTPLAELRKDPDRVSAPCLVVLDDVEKARKVLVGQTVFVREQHVAAGSTRDEVTYLPKFVPVKIIKAGPGQGRLPVRLTFEYVGLSPRQTQEQDYLLSGTNGALTYMNGEPVRDSFLSSFNLKDPRATAAVTNEKHWKAIQQGLLVKGMSMKEVELSMGKPKSKAESMEDGQRTNVWFYSRFQNKQWELLFVNGLLDRYVNYEN